MRDFLRRRWLTLVVATVLLAAMVPGATSCGTEGGGEETTTTAATTIEAPESNVVGEGQTSFTFEVKHLDGTAKTFTVKTDQDSGQTIISGMGELHLDIIIDRLRREFGIEINVGAPQVSYKEALNGTYQMREVFKKQSGGRGKFADIIFEIGPADEGVQGLQFIDEVKGGNVPKEFIPAVQKGFESAMANGPLAGFGIDSMKVTLKDGSFHPVDSDALSFEICARNGFREATPKCQPVLKEPIMKVEVVTPEEYMGDIIGDLNKRRGQIEGTESKGVATAIKAKVPLSGMFGYVTVLRTLSSGRATSTMEFSHFDEVPQNVAKDVIEKCGGKKQELE